MSAQRQTHHEPRRSSVPQTPRELLESPVLICGLGNPGEKYARTRHNAGFAVVDALAERHGVSYWKSEAGCQVAEITLPAAQASAPGAASGEKRRVLLAKPQDFMNTSGGPLSKLARAHHFQPAQIPVIHDEVDLAEGQLNFKEGGGLNSHNGLRSIADKLQTRDFMRLQFGIGRPPGKMPVADYVLRELKGNNLEDFLVTAQAAADQVEQFLRS